MSSPICSILVTIISAPPDLSRTWSLALKAILHTFPFTSVHSVPLVTALRNTIYLYGLELMQKIIGADAMNKEMISQVEADEEILTFDVSDDVLERIGGADQKAVTWAYCTHAWHYCEWPQ